MAGLKFYTSNQLEHAAEQLHDALKAPQSSPLNRECIIVQSPGMARWISFEIARLSGICMNCEFPFPRVFIERMLRQFFPEMSAVQEFSAEVMTWKILQLLPAFSLDPRFALVNQYLAQDDGMKAFQLAEKVAHLFDQYLVYRPEMVMRWEREPGEAGWQALLWRALVRDTQPFHLAAVLDSLSKRMAVLPPNAVLPERVSIFGISSLPPAYLRVFFELARHCEIHLFGLQPSQEYYGHDLPPKLQANLLKKLSAQGSIFTADDLPTGNPLLASLGRLNRDQTEVRIDLDEQAGFLISEENERFFEPGETDLLHTLQGDIFHAHNRGAGDIPKTEIHPDDRSITLHACHSPLREVEVLYDHLLELFAQDPTLKPRDILVMTPDIEKYAPFIHSVFEYPEETARAIPFSVADRSARSDSATVETFLALLTLAGSRCSAPEIFSLLERAPIRSRFNFSDDDLEIIRQWISESGIRWGIDGAHRNALELPSLEANTWWSGLKRLLLGYAMAGENRVSFEGIMPHDEVEGSSAETLGRLITAVEAMFSLSVELPRARRLGEWPDELNRLITQFFVEETPEEVTDLQPIRKALTGLRQAALLAGPLQPVGFHVLRHHLAGLLEQSEQRGGFLTGRVTFCALQPMRSIPARVICLLGMGDQAFPRQIQAPEFDLMARAPKCGDRSSRDDDRYLFLETLISVRHKLYLSYLGRSSSDNEEIPPSVLLSELLDYLDQAMAFPDGQNARQFLLTEHRLHAFSRDYFQGEKLFSYSKANAAASRHLACQKPLPGFFAGALPPPAEDGRSISLQNLINFFANPSKHFVQHRLGIRLEEENETLSDTEPFELNQLEDYSLRQELVRDALEKHTPDSRELVTRGLLPLGQIGIATFHQLNHEANEFYGKLLPELGWGGTGELGKTGKREEALLIGLEIGSFTLNGAIDSIYGGRIVQFRCSGIKPKDRLRAWMSHLAQCAARPLEATRTVLIGTDELVSFAPVPEATALLQRLLEIYWEGQAEPLPFFPVSSLAYTNAALSASDKADSPAKPANMAFTAWHGNSFKEGEKAETYFRFCFPGDPLGERFNGLAMEVLEPMLRYTQANE